MKVSKEVDEIGRGLGRTSADFLDDLCPLVGWKIEAAHGGWKCVYRN